MFNLIFIVMKKLQVLAAAVAMLFAFSTVSIYAQQPEKKEAPKKEVKAEKKADKKEVKGTKKEAKTEKKVVKKEEPKK